MEGILKQTLLFDFYGELLTEHQKLVYEEVVLNDYSLSEAAEHLGISRQGVHDLIRRCGRILDGYEEKLHLVEKFMNLRRKAERIRELAGKQGDESAMREIERISIMILEEL